MFEQDAVVDKYRELASGLPPFPGRDRFRAHWRELAGLGVLNDTGDGWVTEAVARFEGLGLGGLDPGLCYGAASQLFGIQMPLRTLLSADRLALLDGTADGELLLCHASTEEGGGSDPLSCTTTATRLDDGSYRLSGRKAFITAAPVADRGLVFARTGEGRSPFALSAFLVDLDAPGVSRGAPEDKSALPGVPMGSLTFDGVTVPEDRLVLREGAGLTVMAATTACERALLLSYALGPMRRLLEDTVAWSADRRQFDRPMGASHQVAGRVADMAVRVHRCRELVYGMARRFDEGTAVRHLAHDAAMVKISVTEDHLRIAETAGMLAGVRAFIRDRAGFADLASALAGSVYAGPNDLLRVSVARGLGLPVGNH
ncbi:acyl-CoA dehydrogenase family protein [Streptomyces sp. URMC 125]|uniref:acyl-CoA dehydrogenase family protein n=1 Tax=Streptomyces sp. URMC 125 TaxID=3423419 RepID=UPI003F1D9D98